jgi:nucleoid-associated protein YgaU
MRHEFVYEFWVPHDSDDPDWLSPPFQYSKQSCTINGRPFFRVTVYTMAPDAEEAAQAAADAAAAEAAAAAAEAVAAAEAAAMTRVWQTEELFEWIRSLALGN